MLPLRQIALDAVAVPRLNAARWSSSLRSPAWWVRLTEALRAGMPGLWTCSANLLVVDKSGDCPWTAKVRRLYR